MGSVAFMCWLAVQGDPPTPENAARKAAEHKNAERAAAYFAAVDFADRSFPGLTRFSQIGQTEFEQRGVNWLVHLTVDGLNAFGGPIRKPVSVAMQEEGGRFRLVKIEQERFGFLDPPKLYVPTKPPESMEAELAARREAESAKVAAAQQAMREGAARAEAKRKADIAARVEKARADRAAKEAKEKLEGK